MKSLALVGLLLAECQAQRKLQVPTEIQHNELTLARFNSILRTETSAEFAVRSHRSASRSEDLWQQSIARAWENALARETAGHSSVRSTQPQPSQTSFVICDTTIGKQGMQAKEEIAVALGEDQMIVRKDVLSFAKILGLRDLTIFAIFSQR